MGSHPPEWKLPELAEACGVSPRTVRYYVQRGLLPAPVFRGRDTAYGEEHRLRLLAIKKLQERFLPLDAIERELKGRSMAELRALAEGNAPAPVSVSPRVPPRPLPPADAPGPIWLPQPTSRYQRIELARGLELHVGDDADPELKDLAERIRQFVVDSLLSRRNP
ncbi:MAG: MerR family transcriptional regulator [Myxococcaceae bacterium]|nr:MerR family transcriptional regulator [Myxococcaceae bacterium]